ncbi:MAG: hypothetical protein KDA92_10005 [Planctomycetales bacterium]|nr:hypothetical protein [Planctomycetales bacterium]
MTNFEDRLSKAIERGTMRGVDRARQERAQQMSEEELRQLHTRYRLQLSEHIEKCVRKLPQHFPGFQSETLFGDRGWGAACSRDDLNLGGDGRRSSRYSRLEMSIRPYSHLHVVELTGKGTIHNKEVFNRTHFQVINEVDPDTFLHLIDAWVLEYAELFAAAN